ncbi:hypothetical protein F0562_011501 [Nyssa sinensis]|uniref:Uncharacterized protein n=1 Tax=Nyssa sinensis TaxID=561372 RepID=A0A5J4ZSX3_9ASTE|nr:hypothetical protein F0562_011501 [Nyssa sinensis]
MDDIWAIAIVSSDLSKWIVYLLMGLDMELEFDKYCRLDWSPTTVLPSPRHHSKVEKRITKGKPTCGNDRFSLKEDFTEINFHCYRSSSCKSIPSRTSRLEGNEVLKRGSVYQSSKKFRRG